ncbi:MAG: hypothetical protein ACLTY2_01645 [Coprococcus eutactus]
MVTIRDFIENNENVLIIIETAETRNTTDPFRKELWKGMLYDTPKDLQNREVIQEGYGLVAQCNILTILEDGDIK